MILQEKIDAVVPTRERELLADAARDLGFCPNVLELVRVLRRSQEEVLRKLLEQLPCGGVAGLVVRLQRSVDAAPACERWFEEISEKHRTRCGGTLARLSHIAASGRSYQNFFIRRLTLRCHSRNSSSSSTVYSPSQLS